MTTLTAELDLLSMVQDDVALKRVSTHRGGEYKGPCPFCGGEDRLRVQPEHGDGGFWKCRQCGQSGDAIAYAVETGRIDTKQAYNLRHADDVTASPGHTSFAKTPPADTVDPVFDVDTPPGDIWQGRAWRLVVEAQSRLWAEEGAKALDWLRGRGFDDLTIKRAGLGYHAQDAYEAPDVWGLDDGKQLWIPRGVVIPWFIGKDLWRLNIRRPLPSGATGPKYIGPRGYKPAMYNADRLSPGCPAVLVEGEFDAMAIEQELAGGWAAVAVGSASHARRLQWISRLLAAPVVLAVFDRDEEGARARAWWTARLPNAVEWFPKRHDVADMLQAGDDVITWLRYGYGRALRRLGLV